MPGDVGAVATLLNTVASWFMSEDGYAEFAKRRQLAALRKDADAALEKNDFVEHARVVDELRRLSSKP